LKTGGILAAMAVRRWVFLLHNAVEAAIEAEREFVEIGLQVLRANAVVNAA
jgi:hypothetical protein